MKFRFASFVCIFLAVATLRAPSSWGDEAAGTVDATPTADASEEIEVGRALLAATHTCLIQTGVIKSGTPR